MRFCGLWVLELLGVHRFTDMFSKQHPNDMSSLCRRGLDCLMDCYYNLVLCLAMCLTLLARLWRCFVPSSWFCYRMGRPPTLWSSLWYTICRWSNFKLYYPPYHGRGDYDSTLYDIATICLHSWTWVLFSLGVGYHRSLLLSVSYGVAVFS